MAANTKGARVTAIIPSWTGDVSRVMESLKKQTFQDYEVDVVRGVSPAARARNVGARRAPGEILLFIDDDAFFGKDTDLETLVNLLDMSPQIAVVGTSKLVPTTATPLQRAIARQVPRMYYPVVPETTESNPPLNSYGFTAITTTCCVVRKQVFLELRGFDEELTTGPEDTDFFYRVHRQGYKLLVAGDCWVYHDPPASMPDLLRKSFWYGVGHALEARKSPERRMEVIPLDRWYGKILLVLAFLAFPLAFFFHYYFDPVRRLEIGFRPLKTLSTYAVLCGYAYGWFHGKPQRATTTYMGKKGAFAEETAAQTPAPQSAAEAAPTFTAGQPSAGVQPGLISPYQVVPDRPFRRTDETARGALLLVSSAVTIGILNYALNIILGWTLPTEEYGRVGVSQTIIVICSWFLSAGFPLVVTRAIAQANGAGPKDSPAGALAWRTYKAAWVANSVLACLIAGLVLLAFNMRWLPLEATYSALVPVVALTVWGLGLSVVPDAGLQGLFRFGRSAIVRLAEAVTNIIISVSLVVLGFRAVGALFGFALAAIFKLVLGIWYMRDKPINSAKGFGGFGTVRAALPIMLAVFGGVLLSNIDLLAIKFLSVPVRSDLLSGSYQVAAVLARAPFFVGSALISAFYPGIARDSFDQSRPHSGGGLMKWLSICVLPINVVMVVAAPAVIGFFFPANYVSVALSLSLLSAGSAFLVFSLALASVLQASNMVKGPAFAMSAAVIVQVVGLAALVPQFGLQGAALASVIAGGIAFVLMVWQGQRQVTLFSKQAARQVSALMLLAVLVVPLSLWFPQAGRVVIAAWVLAALAVYIVSLFVLGILRADDIAASANLPERGAAAGWFKGALAVGSALNSFGRKLGPTGKSEIAKNAY